MTPQDESTELVIEHLRIAQRHLGHAVNRLGRAGLDAWGKQEWWERIYGWQRAVRELQVALYQEGIKLLEE